MGPPSVTSCRPEAVTSTRLSRGEAPICGGLSLDLGARVLGPRRAAMVVPITNSTEYPWRGSVALVMNGTTIPVCEITTAAPGLTSRPAGYDVGTCPRRLARTVIPQS
jgi:hypothetical protein